MPGIDIWRLQALLGHLSHVVEREPNADAYRIVVFPDILPQHVGEVLGCKKEEIVFKTTNGHVNVFNISAAVAERGVALPQNADPLRKLQFLREALEDQGILIDYGYMYPAKNGTPARLFIKVSEAAAEKICAILEWKSDQVIITKYGPEVAHIDIPWRTLDAKFGYPYGSALDPSAIGTGARNVRELLRHRYKPRISFLAEISNKELTENLAYFRFLVRKEIENTHNTPSTADEMLAAWVWAERIVHNKHEQENTSLIRVARIVRTEITAGAERNNLENIRLRVNPEQSSPLQNWVRSERATVQKRSLREFGAVVGLSLN